MHWSSAVHCRSAVHSSSAVHYSIAVQTMQYTADPLGGDSIFASTFPLRFSVQILFVKWLTGLSLGRLHSNGFYRPYHSHHTSRKKHSNKNFCLFKIFTDHRFYKFRFRFSRYQGIRIKGMEMVIYQAWESQSHGFADGFLIFSACARNLSYLNPTVKEGAEQCRLLLNYY